jgi:uncharacterized membrane protein HdeD (DUF308 family)
MFDTTTDEATVQSVERGTASLPDIAGNAVRQRVAALLHRPVRDESTSSVTRGILAIATGVAALAFPEISLGAMLIVFGVYAIADAALAIVTAFSVAHRRWRLVAQAVVDLAVVAFAVGYGDVTRSTALTLLAVWVVVMGALRLRDAFEFNGGVHVNVLLAVLAMLAITAGVEAMASPDDHVSIVMINVWIFTILRGVMLLASSKHPTGPKQ